MIFVDALLRVKTRDEGIALNKACRRPEAAHIGLGVRADGDKEIPAFRLKQNQGAKLGCI